VISTKTFLTAICASVIGLSSYAYAETTASSSPKLPFSEDQRAAMEDFVRNFILDNPEVLMESVNRHRTNEDKKKEQGSVDVLKANMAYLTNGTHPEIGNPKGDVMIVEFFDYNCGYCKHAMEVVRKLSENDKNVRIIFMDLPILSPQSSIAAKWAVAANKQGKYWAFHQALLESNAPKDEENLTKIAITAGLDVTKLKKDAESKEIEEYLKSVKEFADKLSISGTPAFIIGERIIRGYMDFEPFKSLVEEQRNIKR